MGTLSSAGAGVGATGLSPVDLIRGPEGAEAPAGGVLLNVWTGAVSRAGDLRPSLEGSRSADRDRDAALTAHLLTPQTRTLPGRSRPPPAGDSLSPTARPSAAELPTPGLRCAWGLRSARPWITSETVSAEAAWDAASRSLRVRHQARGCV